MANIKATLQAIRALGCTASYRNEGKEYRVNLPSPKGTEATAYYTNDADDAIATARHMAENNPTLSTQLQREISNFRVMLVGPKFTGTDDVWQDCKACGDRHVYRERKDWISTGDVLRWLDGLDSLLRS